MRECVLHHVELIVLEPTGKFHRLLHQQLHDAEIWVAIVNPFPSQQFKDNLGHMAKTDKIDARKGWQKNRPELSSKRPNNQAGCGT
ncbi:MAG: transposase [Pseudomonadota bacterium]